VSRLTRALCLAACILPFVMGGCLPRVSSRTELPPPIGPQPDLDVLVTTVDRTDPWWEVVEAVRSTEPECVVVRVSPTNPAAAVPQLAKLRPEYGLLVLPPEHLDVNFAWRWLSAASRLDDDPFTDLCYGVITGGTPEEAISFWNRTQEAAHTPSIISPTLLDCLGPNQLNNDRVFVHRRLFWAGWLRGKIDARGMNNGLRGFADADLPKLSGYGILHFGGHGYPERIDHGLTAEQLSRAQLSPSVVFSGACSTGVTHRAFEMGPGGWQERTYAPDESFCLTMLRQPVVAYFAATHPDHGVPVYQEMEYWLTTGCTLGEAMKHTYDGVAVANGGRALDFPVLKGGEPLPGWGPTEIMLYGTASRVLFGDPRLRVCGPVHDRPVSVADSTLTVADPQVAYSLTDTYHSDTSAVPNGFNDRVYGTIPLAPGEPDPTEVTARAEAGGRAVESRVVGFAVEEWGGSRLLHVQVDPPSTGYLQGPIRRKGATVALTLGPAQP